MGQILAQILEHIFKNDREDLRTDCRKDFKIDFEQILRDHIFLAQILKLILEQISNRFAPVANEFEVNDFFINLKVAFLQETIWLRCL